MLLNVFIPRPPPLPPSTPAFIHEKHRTRNDDIYRLKRRNLLSTPVPARGSAAFAMRPIDFAPQSPPPLRMIISALLLLCVGARETMSGRKHAYLFTIGSWYDVLFTLRRGNTPMLFILVLESVQIRQPSVQVGEFSTASCYRAGKRRNCRRAPPSPRLNLALLLFPSRTRVVTYLPLPPSSANPPLHSRRLSPSASLLLSPLPFL